MVLKYATTLQLNAFINLSKSVPEFSEEELGNKELVGYGNNSSTIFNLNHKYIIDGSYVFYYGASCNNLTALTETTHYTIDLDKSVLTLTTSGKTVVGSNKIYADYSVNIANLNDSFLNDVLERSEVEVDRMLNTTFTDGSVTNPSYPSVEEYHESKGLFDSTYFSKKRPLINVTSLLADDITSASTSLTVTTGDGKLFSSSGKVLIDSEVISYTGVTTDTLTGLTRGVGDSTAASHTAATRIDSTIIELSDTEQGTTPVFTILKYNSEAVCNEDLGKIYIYNNTDLLSRDGINNRFRITYYYGWKTIPASITRLTLLLAAKELMNSTVRKAHITGMNSFNPELINVDFSEIDRIVNLYREIPMSNT
jgi:hypothetical protein